MPATTLHTGAWAPQSASSVHPLQVFVASSQLGFSGWQSRSTLQGTQMPWFGPVVAQTGVSGVPSQSASVLQTGTQVSVAVLHAGLSIGQSAFVTHSTQS